MPTILADRVTAEPCGQAESPRWLGGDRVCWVDMSSGSLHIGRFAAGRIETARVARVGDRIGSAARIHGSADWAVTSDRSLLRLAPDGALSTIADLPPGEGYLNDGICDPAGRFWTGTQTADRSPAAALYCIRSGAQDRATERLGGLTVANGICFSADGRTLFLIDTLPHRAVDAFDVAPDGTLDRRRRLFAVTGGNPDGMAIDDAGALWIAVWGAGEARHYAQDGRLLASVRVPARRASAVALVDDTLLITTAVDPHAGAHDQGGHLFAVPVQTAGQPAADFSVALSE